MTNFGKKLLTLREASGLTQGQLDLLAGLSKSTVSRRESGKHTPSWHTACLLADALKVSTEAFREDTGS